MQREASMKESTFIFPAQDNNGPVCVCMYIDILMTYYWKVHKARCVFYVQVSAYCNSVHFCMLCNVHTHKIKLQRKQ